MDADDLRGQGALIPRSVKEQDAKGKLRCGGSDLVLILQQHIGPEPLGGLALVEGSLYSVTVDHLLKEGGQARLGEPPLGAIPVLVESPGDNKEAMAIPMELLYSLPRAWQEGTRIQKVRLIKRCEECPNVLGWDFGVAPENLPPGLGDGNL